MGDSTVLKKWLILFIKSKLDELRPEKRHKGHKWTEDGYISVECKDSRVVQLREVIGQQARQVSKLQDATHSISVKFTDECANAFRQSSGRALTSIEPGALLKIHRYLLVLQGSNGQLFWQMTTKKTKQPTADEVVPILHIEAFDVVVSSGKSAMGSVQPVYAVDDVRRALAKFLKKDGARKESRAEDTSQWRAVKVSETTKEDDSVPVYGHKLIRQASKFLAYDKRWADSGFDFDAAEYIIPRKQLELLEVESAWCDPVREMCRVEQGRREQEKKEREEAEKSKASPVIEKSRRDSEVENQKDTSTETPVRNPTAVSGKWVGERIVRGETPPSTAESVDASQPFEWTPSPSRPAGNSRQTIEQRESPSPAQRNRSPPRSTPVIRKTPSPTMPPRKSAKRIRTPTKAAVPSPKLKTPPPAHSLPSSQASSPLSDIPHDISFTPQAHSPASGTKSPYPPDTEKSASEGEDAETPKAPARNGSDEPKVAPRLLMSAVMVPARAKLVPPKVIYQQGAVAAQKYGVLNSQHYLYRKRQMRRASKEKEQEEGRSGEAEEEIGWESANNAEDQESASGQLAGDIKDAREENDRKIKVETSPKEVRKEASKYHEVVDLTQTSPVRPEPPDYAMPDAPASQVEASIDPSPAHSILEEDSSKNAQENVVEDEVEGGEGEQVQREEDEDEDEDDVPPQKLLEPLEEAQKEKPEKAQPTSRQVHAHLAVEKVERIEVYQTQVHSSGSTNAEVSCILETPSLKSGSFREPLPPQGNISSQETRSVVSAEKSKESQDQPTQSQQDIEMPDAEPQVDSQQSSKSSEQAAQRQSPLLPIAHSTFRQKAASTSPPAQIHADIPLLQESRKRRASAASTLTSPERRPSKQMRRPSPTLSPERTLRKGPIMIDSDSDPDDIYTPPPSTVPAQLHKNFRKFTVGSTPTLRASSPDGQTFKEPTRPRMQPGSPKSVRPQQPVSARPATAAAAASVPASASRPNVASSSTKPASPPSRSNLPERLTRIAGWQQLSASQHRHFLTVHSTFSHPSIRLTRDAAILTKRRETQKHAMDFLRWPDRPWEDRSQMPLAKFVVSMAQLKLVQAESEDARRELEEKRLAGKKGGLMEEMEREREELMEMF